MVEIGSIGSSVVVRREDDNTTHYCISGPWYDPEAEIFRTGTLAIPKRQLGAYCTCGDLSKLAQFYGIVAPGIGNVQHIFQGLKRRLYAHNNLDADRDKLVYSWKPHHDFEWRGGSQGDIFEPDSPRDRVFVTILTPNFSQYRKIDGWLERWNWIVEDGSLANAPKNHDTRYDAKRWSKP